MEAARLAPSDALVLHALAERKAGAGDLAAAESLLLRAVAAAGEDTVREQDALVSLGACAIASERWDVARSYLERALEHDPQDARALGNLGYVLVKLGEKRDGRRFLSCSAKPRNAGCA